MCLTLFVPFIGPIDPVFKVSYLKANIMAQIRKAPRWIFLRRPLQMVFSSFFLHALVMSTISETKERVKKQKFEKDKATWEDRLKRRKEKVKEIEASVRNCRLQKKRIGDWFKAKSDAVKNAAIISLVV